MKMKGMILLSIKIKLMFYLSFLSFESTSAIEKAETSKTRLDASVELKKATARLEGINYLS